MIEVRCPACDKPLKGNLGRVPASIGEEAVRVAIDCQACAESLQFVTRSSGTWRVIGGDNGAG